MTQTITVEDTTAPVLSVPADYTVECADEMPLEEASATDNCSDVTVETFESIIEGDCPNNFNWLERVLLITLVIVLQRHRL